jgi:hypothetical protein
MQIFLDDLRSPPNEEWRLIRDPREAMALLATGLVTKLSLDHDLGCFDERGQEITGYTVACYVEELVFWGRIPLPEITCHSDNPVGVKKILCTVARMSERKRVNKP